MLFEANLVFKLFALMYVIWESTLCLTAMCNLKQGGNNIKSFDAKAVVMQTHMLTRSNLNRT